MTVSRLGHIPGSDSASKELRMIGWRVGWVVGPASIVRDVSLVGMANVVGQVGQVGLADYLRLVFANEPVERLGDLRQRFDAAFA